MELRTFLYRTQIPRRTLLGSGALVGIGALLAADGSLTASNTSNPKAYPGATTAEPTT